MDEALAQALRTALTRELERVRRYTLQAATRSQGSLGEALIDLAWDALRRATQVARLLDPPQGPAAVSGSASPPDRRATGGWVAADLDLADRAIREYRRSSHLAEALDAPQAATALANLALDAEDERHRLRRLLPVGQHDLAGRRAPGCTTASHVAS